MLKITIIKRSQKSIRLRIKNHQNVILSVPKHYNNAHCEQIIEQNRKWIESKILLLQTKERELSQLTQTQKILYFGQWLDIAKFANPKEILANDLKDLICKYASELANKMSLRYEDIKLTNAKSYFGLCTNKNLLKFSLMLCFAPKNCIEYVVIHELSHIAHKNHSKNFWNLVEEFCPDYKCRRKMLHKNAEIYKRMLTRIF